MSLLEKFSKVEVKADERISAEDRHFCEVHQSAYDDARSSLQELKFYWETMLESQKQLLSFIKGGFAKLHGSSRVFQIPHFCLKNVHRVRGV